MLDKPMKSLAFVAIALVASSVCCYGFVPSSPAIAGARTIAISASSSRSQTALCAAQAPTPTVATATNGRRRLLRCTLATATSSLLLALAGAAPALAASSTDAPSYASSVEGSANALSQSLGHALSVVDALNAQAGRLSSFPSSPAHPVAVLDGMTVQARRLTRDLDRCVAVLNGIKDEANDVTSGYVSGDDGLRIAAKSISRASCVLDGLVAQGRRLEGAVASADAAAVAGGRAVDDKIVYMLSVLDGLNAQVNRLDVGETFGVLDEINARAARSLLRG
ncbi:hypothetical protein ACHAW5_002397 [Stephanodiscus triporus]|uniref:Pectinesterase inhibitor domain-containing protein n=1 Tax=Stephanodiscus triporus TaxID=2934178 RepID=A0ABD3NR08_9STRA